jgi:hypothetical protein
MDIFNMYPAGSLSRVCDAYCDFIVRNDPAVFAGWGQAEWALAPQTAFVLGVGALIHAQHRNDPRWLTLPEPFRRALARQYGMNQQRTLRMRQELDQVLAAFRDARIPTLPLKGIVLSHGYYDDRFTRPMADLDLLIQAGDLPRADETLGALGYLAENHSAKPNFVRPENRYVVCFDADHPDNPRRIEIHTRLQDEFRSSTIDWTDRAWHKSSTGAAGTAPREIAPAVLFAHLLSHTSRDMMTCRVRLIQLYDIALVARRLTRDAGWSDFDVPEDAATMRFLYPALAVTRRYFACDIPDAFFLRVARATPPRLRAWCDGQTLWDVSWLGGNHLGVLKTLALWALSSREASQMFETMWGRRGLHLGYLFPQFQGSPRAWLAYPAYVWDQLRGGPREKKRRGRWDYSNLPPDGPPHRDAWQREEP